MHSKHTRAGGKFCGSHTTLTPAACQIADIAAKCPFCTKITIGFITPGLSPSNGQNRVKILKEDSSILLIVRGGTSIQEVRVYSYNTQLLAEEIIKKALDLNFKISFK